MSAASPGPRPEAAPGFSACIRAKAIEDAARVADRAAEAAGELAEVELDDEIRDFHLAQQHACESVALAIRALAARS